MIILMGISGAGKGTQGALLAKEMGLKVISTGELLRTYGSEEQHARMKTGIFLGDEEVTALLDKALSELPDQNAVILDGYPRRISQADWLLEQEKQGRFKIERVLEFNISREAVKARLLDRARPDDHDSAIEGRFREYEKDALPVLEHLKQANMPVTKINGDQPVEAVHAEVVAAFKHA
ncbi:MAG: oxidoreductase [Candidatus Saccharibacteria bacterium]|nr:oxidoreductase [Candidatus Saccharibacteria bacterium]